MNQLTALLIMDGYGLSDKTEGNAVIGNSPYVGYLMQNYPWTTLKASGEAVGLPKGQMGNSEVGHLNIGAGRVVYQELSRISTAIKDGGFFVNPAFDDAISNVKKTGGSLHLMGLVSDGGVHSHLSHLFALLELARKNDVKNVYVHCFTDGRDTAPQSAIGFVNALQGKMDELGVGKIASVCGRYYAMDRDGNYDRVEKAYNALTLGIGKTSDDPVNALAQSYVNGVTDEFVEPTVITTVAGTPVATINNGDSVVFFNFRPDRARQLTRAFTQKGFDGFSLKGKQRNVFFVTMTVYDETFTNVAVAFPKQQITNTLGAYLATCGKTQLRIAETEKYAHVTFFFNGGVEKPEPNEVRILVNSPKVATYDLQPSMSAPEVCERAASEINREKYDFIVLNFANCDMVGHTGNFNATCEAVKVVDDCVRQVVEAVLQTGGRVFVTADHGNAEKMLDENGNPFTAHTTSEVPFVMVDNALRGKAKLRQGKLCDVAPTVLKAMGLKKPSEMTGKSLIITN